MKAENKLQTVFMRIKRVVREHRIATAMLLIWVFVVIALAFVMRCPYKVGMSVQHVQLEMIHPSVIKQLQHKGRHFSRISSGASARILEVWTDYYLWQKKPIFTRWYTCTLDSNSVIVKIESDWDWRGLP